MFSLILFTFPFNHLFCSFITVVDLPHFLKPFKHEKVNCKHYFYTAHCAVWLISHRCDICTKVGLPRLVLTVLTLLSEVLTNVFNFQVNMWSVLFPSSVANKNPAETKGRREEKQKAGEKKNRVNHWGHEVERGTLFLKTMIALTPFFSWLAYNLIVRS